MDLDELQQILFRYEDKLMRYGVLVGITTESMLAINLVCRNYSDAGLDKINIHIEIETSGTVYLDEEVAEVIADTTRDYLKNQGFFQEIRRIDLQDEDIDWFSVSYVQC